MHLRLFCGLMLLSFLMLVSAAGAESGYREPSETMKRLALAPPTPTLVLNPRGGTALVVRTEDVTDLSDLFQPVLRLAGVRFYPLSHTKQRFSYVVGIGLLDLMTGEERSVELPEGKKWGFPSWSPDGTRWAMTLYDREQAQVWLFDAETRVGKPLPHKVNNLLLSPFEWVDAKTLLLATVPVDQGSAPQPLPYPDSPNVQETSGKVAQVRTFQDLLRTDQDERMFEYYVTVQLMLHDVPAGAAKPLGKPGLYAEISRSPDGTLWLVDRILKPFSRAVPVELFAHRYEIWNADGSIAKTLADLPDQEQVPIRGVPTGMRSVHWQTTASSTLMWVEALDGGNPLATATYRDRLLAWPSPFTALPRELLRLPERYWGMEYLASPGLALISDHNLETQWDRTWLIDCRQSTSLPLELASAPESGAFLLFSLSGKDAYNAPGRSVTTTRPDGRTVVQQDGDDIFLAGAGATPQGDLPFLRRFNLNNRTTREIFRSATGTYEFFAGFGDEAAQTLITRFETPAISPNFRRRSVDGDGTKVATLTRFPDPAPELSSIRKELIQYKRPDGIPLSGTLYYPVGYASGTRVPVIVWAYPREYVSPDTAGQVRAVPNRYARLDGTSILLMLLDGYAVLFNAEIPVVGKPLEANNTYVEQITAAAQAAVDTLVEKGVADRHRIGIAGHSYGAFMVANLLAHTDLFAAGVARSGAYNRTLTPFGFQAERRTYWQATDIYTRLSPFTYAHRINEPLLMFHGELDENTGTFPMQSERLFAAIKGHGGTARLVLLPGETHAYRARESILHVLAETVDWCDRFIKNRPAPVATATETSQPTRVPEGASH